MERYIEYYEIDIKKENTFRRQGKEEKGKLLFQGQAF